MIRKTKFWVILILIVLLLCTAAVILNSFVSDSNKAEIYLDGELYKTIDLNAVTIPYSFDIKTENGSNTVTVEHGKIKVSDADCPDKICVNTGWIPNGAAPIVCLPHELVIRTDKSSRYDAAL